MTKTAHTEPSSPHPPSLYKQLLQIINDQDFKKLKKRISSLYKECPMELIHALTSKTSKGSSLLKTAIEIFADSVSKVVTEEDLDADHENALRNSSDIVMNLISYGSTIKGVRIEIPIQKAIIDMLAKYDVDWYYSKDGQLILTDLSASASDKNRRRLETLLKISQTKSYELSRENSNQLKALLIASGDLDLIEEHGEAMRLHDHIANATGIVRALTAMTSFTPESPLYQKYQKPFRHLLELAKKEGPKEAARILNATCVAASHTGIHDEVTVMGLCCTFGERELLNEILELPGIDANKHYRIHPPLSSSGVATEALLYSPLQMTILEKDYKMAYSIVTALKSQDLPKIDLDDMLFRLLDPNDIEAHELYREIMDWFFPGKADLMSAIVLGKSAAEAEPAIIDKISIPEARLLTALLQGNELEISADGDANAPSPYPGIETRIYQRIDALSREFFDRQREFFVRMSAPVESRKKSEVFLEAQIAIAENHLIENEVAIAHMLKDEGDSPMITKYQETYNIEDPRLITGCAHFVCDQNGKTILHHAAKNHNMAILEYVVKNHDIKEAACKEGNTPLMEACIAGNKEAAILLIEQNIDSNIIFALAALIQRSDEKSTVFLVKALKDLGKLQDFLNINVEGGNPLLIACKQNMSALTTILIEEGSNPEPVDSAASTTPLMWALFNKNEELAIKLINSGANLFTTDNVVSHLPVLHIAAKTILPNVVQAMIAKAKENGILKRLINHEAGEDSPKVAGHNALKILCLTTKTGKGSITADQQEKSLVIAKMLMDHGITLEKNGQSAFETACANQNHKLAATIIAHERSDRKKISQLVTDKLLTFSCSVGDIDTIKVFIREFPDLDVNKKSPAKDGSFTTPFLIAISNGHFRVASLMIDYGAEVTPSISSSIAKNTDQSHRLMGKHPILFKVLENALHLKDQNKEGECLELMTKIVDIAPETLQAHILNQSPLYHAISLGFFDIAQMLLNKGSKADNEIVEAIKKILVIKHLSGDRRAKLGEILIQIFEISPDRLPIISKAIGLTPEMISEFPMFEDGHVQNDLTAHEAVKIAQLYKFEPQEIYEKRSQSAMQKLLFKCLSLAVKKGLHSGQDIMSIAAAAKIQKPEQELTEIKEDLESLRARSADLSKRSALLLARQASQAAQRALKLDHEGLVAESLAATIKAKAEGPTLKERISALESELSSKSADLVAEQQKATSAQQKAALEQEKAKEALEQAKSEQKALKGVNRKLQSDLAILTEQLKQVRESKAELQKKLKHESRTTKKLSQGKERLASRLQTVVQERDTALAAKAGLHTKESELRVREEQLRHELAGLRRDKSQQKQDSKALAGLQTNLADAEAKLAQSTQEKSQLAASLTAAQNAAAVFESQRQEYGQALAYAAEQRSALEAEISRLREEAARTTQEVRAKIHQEYAEIITSTQASADFYQGVVAQLQKRNSDMYHQPAPTASYAAPYAGNPQQPVPRYFAQQTMPPTHLDGAPQQGATARFQPPTPAIQTSRDHRPTPPPTSIQPSDGKATTDRIRSKSQAEK